MFFHKMLVVKMYLEEEHPSTNWNLRCRRCRWFDRRWIRSNPLSLCLFFRFLFGNSCFFIFLRLSKHCHSISNGGGFWSSTRHAEAWLASWGGWGSWGSLVPWMRWGRSLLEHWAVIRKEHHAAPFTYWITAEDLIYTKLFYSLCVAMDVRHNDNAKSLMHNLLIFLTRRCFDLNALKISVILQLLKNTSLHFKKQKSIAHQRTGEIWRGIGMKSVARTFSASGPSRSFQITLQ